jgi:hypothetical protein
MQTPRSLVVSQSPVWDNWQAVPKIAPPNLDDAPVLLTKSLGDYWIFGLNSNKNPADNFTHQEAKLEGFDIPLQTTQWPNQFNAPGGLKKSLGGYHAWQSRDASLPEYRADHGECFDRTKHCTLSNVLYS